MCMCVSAVAVRWHSVRIAVALVCVCVTRWCVRESGAGSGRAERSEVRGAVGALVWWSCACGWGGGACRRVRPPRTRIGGGG